VTARCYLDVSIGGAPAERLDIELYGELAPMAAENFRCLCTGEKGFGYVGSSFYKVLQGLAVQGGDVDGNGLGRSIYGPSFVHDNYSIMHNTAGLVSMVNTGVGGASGASDSRFSSSQLMTQASLMGGMRRSGACTMGWTRCGSLMRCESAATRRRPWKRSA